MCGRLVSLLLALGLVSQLTGCADIPPIAAQAANTQEDQQVNDESNVQLATFGGGCFWCTEAVFLELKGVSKVVSGYEGGHVENPTYQQVCQGTTGHAEVIQITFDPAVVDYQDLLEVFFATHDPTTLNRQGNDVGTQYRSVIFYHDKEQQEIAEYYKQKLDESGKFKSKIVTEITPAAPFYPAEEYHQNFFAKNPRQGYCVYTIPPKIKKLKQQFGDKLKEK